MDDLKTNEEEHEVSDCPESDVKTESIEPASAPVEIDVKRDKKKESNASYYKKIREKLKKADEPDEAPQEAQTPKPKVKARPKPKAKAKATELPEKVKESRQRTPSPPTTPRTRMVQAYREARLADQERKRHRYKSWFE